MSQAASIFFSAIRSCLVVMVDVQYPSAHYAAGRNGVRLSTEHIKMPSKNFVRFYNGCFQQSRGRQQ
jgi:hypothetical protein